MKNLRRIVTAAVLAAALTFNTGVSVSAAEGYSLNDELAASEYYSLEDYFEYSPEVREIVKNDTGSRRYETVCNYICLPASLADKTDSISEIFITPDYCKTTFDLEDGKTEFCHYFSSDNKDSCYYFEIYADGRHKETIGDSEIYGLNRTGTSYFTYNGCYFSVTIGSPVTEDDVTVVKLYADSHLQEKNSSLYYINDNGKQAKGWKTVGGNRYYFKKNGKAVQNSTYKADGIMYKFNANGVCTGKYTGYIKKKDGSRVYYEDGVISE